MKARTSIFLPDLGGGGAERSMLNLANAFSRAGLDVDLVLARAVGPYLKDVDAELNVINLNALKATSILWRLSSYLRCERPSTLISAMDSFNVLALLASVLSERRTAIITTSHTRISTHMSWGGNRLRDRLLPMAARMLYPKAKRCVAVSEGIANELAELARIPRDSISVIPNPVDIARVRRLAAEPPAHRWYERGCEPVVLTVGRLGPEKDHETLIRAFAAVARSAKLLILGEGQERDRLEALVADLGLTGQVELPGFTDNPYAHMANAAVFVLSSVFEGLPTVLVEALACGCPVISTDCPSGPFEILKGGTFGSLVPVRDSFALAEAIELHLRTPTRADLLRARADEFDMDVALKRYLQLLSESPGEISF